MMIDQQADVDNEFQQVEDEDASKKAFGKSMETLTSYCKDEAGPKFAKISDVNLAPLCQIPSADDVYSVFEKRKTEVKSRIDYCLTHLMDFTPEQVEDSDELSPPVLLGKVTGAYPSPSFSSAYLPQWEKDGPFLTAMAKLRESIDALEDFSKQIVTSITGLKSSLKDNIEKSKIARKALQDAIDKNTIAVAEKAKADQLLAEQEAQEKIQNANLDELEDTAHALGKKYKDAMSAFNKHFLAGTNLALLEKKKQKGSFLRPVKRVG